MELLDLEYMLISQQYFVLFLSDITREKINILEREFNLSWAQTLNQIEHGHRVIVTERTSI